MLRRCLALASLLCGLLAAPAGAITEPAGPTRHLGLDTRTARIAPTAGQRDAVASLGARATWSRFGTPASLTADRAPLATGLAADPEQAARAFLRAHAGLFRLDAQGVDALQLVNVAPIGAGRSVLLRQRFGELEPGDGGLVAVGVRDGSVEYVSSSLTGAATAPAPSTLTAQDAFRRAAASLGLTVAPSAIANLRTVGGWATFDVKGLSQPARARLVALPVPGAAPRAAFKTLVVDVRAGRAPLAATTFVDARTGEILARHDDVDYAAADFSAFSANPPLDYSGTDSRRLWCFTPHAGCAFDQSTAGTPERTGEWDTLQTTPDGPAVPTHTTQGNAARAAEAWTVPLAPGPLGQQATSLTREYTAPWTNAWHRSRCAPTNLVPGGNDIDAATTNLFVAHNRMHDFAYRLGFTEANYNMQVSNLGRGGADGDPELGDAQAGALTGGQPTELGRDNANQITLDDGIPPITNMYLWQSLAAGFYAPCVDGDYDMSVIGHEYTHAISNRMIAGPSEGITGTEGGSMGESWSDLDAMEYLHAYGLLPSGGENPWAVGAYVTGDEQRGIRDYALDANPLNYADVGFDVTGVEVHADGEIWNGIQFAQRQAFNRKYDAAFPSSDAGLQRRCADGVTPVASCPGNRRWIQLIYDSFLLAANGNVSMPQMRDAMLAADRLRFGGADQAIMWSAFAARGLGQDAVVDPVNLDDSRSPTDVSPKPSFRSPLSGSFSTLRLAPTATSGAAPAKVQLFVGDFQARVTPVADTDPSTDLGDRVDLEPGTYTFIARAAGFGAVRFTRTIAAGRRADLPVAMQPNVASAARGARITGDAGASVDPNTGDPVDATPAQQQALLRNLIDDDEGTTWASRGTGPVAGRQVTIALAGGLQTIGRVQVSALLRPADPDDAGGDTDSQNRFTALRRFAIEACTAAAANGYCADDAGFMPVATSPADAFPSVAPRPRAPELTLRSFAIPSTRATHLRLRVLSNQCTGQRAYAGDTDADPTNDADCPSSDKAGTVRAAELEAFAK
jgi:extracellular elastinolytic metalloproteinase